MTIDPNKFFYIIDLKNRNYITSIKYISSINKIILSILLVFGINIIHKWCQYNNFDNNIIIGKKKLVI